MAYSCRPKDKQQHDEQLNCHNAFPFSEVEISGNGWVGQYTSLPVASTTRLILKYRFMCKVWGQAKSQVVRS
jgi:hypothetical protein